jgi:hypothetical protein
MFLVPSFLIQLCIIFYLLFTIDTRSSSCTKPLPTGNIIKVIFITKIFRRHRARRTSPHLMLGIHRTLTVVLPTLKLFRNTAPLMKTDLAIIARFKRYVAVHTGESLSEVSVGYALALARAVHAAFLFGEEVEGGDSEFEVVFGTVSAGSPVVACDVIPEAAALGIDGRWGLGDDCSC